MTTMYTGMCTLSGTTGAIREMTTFDRTRTNRVARPMERPLMAEVVVASVGHMPSSRTKVGLFLTRPSVMSFQFLAIVMSFQFLAIV